MLVDKLQRIFDTLSSNEVTMEDIESSASTLLETNDDSGGVDFSEILEVGEKITHVLQKWFDSVVTKIHSGVEPHDLGECTKVLLTELQGEEFIENHRTVITGVAVLNGSIMIRKIVNEL